MPDVLQQQRDLSVEGPAAPTAIEAAALVPAAATGRGARTSAAAPGSSTRASTVTMVCFRAAGTAYCIPVEFTRSVRTAVGLVSLPVPRPDTVGVLEGDPPLTVIAPLGTGGGHVLVVSAGGSTLGLLVDEVIGLVTVPADDVGGAPGGQYRPLISGTVNAAGRLFMVADPRTMVEQL